MILSTTSKIGGIIAYDDTIELNLDFRFKFHLDTMRLQFHLHGALIKFLQETKAENIVNFELRTNDLLRYRLQRKVLIRDFYLCFICGHLWLK